MLAVVFVHNSKKNADKYVHADNDENDKEQAGPRVIVIGWHPVKKTQIWINWVVCGICHQAQTVNNN